MSLSRCSSLLFTAAGCLQWDVVGRPASNGRDTSVRLMMRPMLGVPLGRLTCTTDTAPGPARLKERLHSISPIVRGIGRVMGQADQRGISLNCRGGIPICMGESRLRPTVVSALSPVLAYCTVAAWRAHEVDTPVRPLSLAE